MGSCELPQRLRAALFNFNVTWRRVSCNASIGGLMELNDLWPFYVLNVLVWSSSSDRLISILFCGNVKVRACV